ncbi:hypothetical protein SAMN04488057_103315 [Cyclobacterium lianum]|uniref:Uncharacterized protein n=1 Tax=Cyclobacterium lianum TaxID=388280 RepID=A0A1M7LK02_9BACT|nr:hypothetical protein SAMN04488057_103315 [Cyclobacterium lianum]
MFLVDDKKETGNEIPGYDTGARYLYINYFYALINNINSRKPLYHFHFYRSNLVIFGKIIQNLY